MESMLLRSGKYFLFDRHMKRLARSAAYFGVPVKTGAAAGLLRSYASGSGKQRCKIRLLVDASGSMEISGSAVAGAGPSKKRIAISGIMTDPDDIFLKHKTTHRQLYDREYKKYRKKGFYDVIFFNKKGGLTEAHSSNIFIKKGGYFFTPPVSCGLLPGTYRGMLLAKGVKYREKVLYKKDLLNADSVYICNSVRGMRRVYL